MYSIVILVVILALVFMRYLPVRGVESKDASELNYDIIKVVDVRDYNESYKAPVTEAINIPIAYLKRYHAEIPKAKVHVIAADPLERNLSIRFLRRKGYEVIGYTLTKCS